MTRSLPRLALIVLLSTGCGEPPAPEPDPLAEGWRAARAGDHEAAASHYAEAASQRPDDVAAWMGRAREELRAEHPAEARDAARRAVELAQESPDAHELLGRALLAVANAGPADQAAAATAEGEGAAAAPSQGEASAAEGVPSEGGADDGAADAPLGPAAEAAAELARALELDPARTRLHFPLARAHERAGDRDAAIEAYRASADAGVLAARALAAAARVRLDGIGAGRPSEEVLRAIEQELDRAEELAGDDQAAIGAIVAQRRRIARKRDAARLLTAADPVRALIDRQIAENAGLLGVLAGTGGMDNVFGGSALGAVTDRDVFGGLAGDSIGTGGLGLRGSGGSGGTGLGGLGSRGGGGTGEGTIGLGNLGTIGRSGGGSGSGYGRGGRIDRPRREVQANVGTVRVTGALPSEAVQRVVRRYANQVRYCYERELMQNPSLGGTLTLALEIDGAGRVTGSRVASSTLGNAEVEGCVAGRGRRMAFPPAEGGTTAVQVPYTFRSSAGD